MAGTRSGGDPGSSHWPHEGWEGAGRRMIREPGDLPRDETPSSSGGEEVFIRLAPRPPVGAFSFGQTRARLEPAPGGTPPDRTFSVSGGGFPSPPLASRWGSDTAPNLGNGPSSRSVRRRRRSASRRTSALALVRVLLLATAFGIAPGCGGRTREEPAAPRVPPGGGPRSRIVSLAPNLTEILFALGLGARVVGVTDFCDFPPEARGIAKVGGFVNPSSEAILALRPDLIVATPNVGNRAFVERVISAGARVEVVQARDVEEIYLAIEAIARAAGVPESGAELARQVRRDLARETARVASLPRVRALLCLQVEPLLAAGPSSFPGDLLEAAGAVNIVPASAGAYPTISLESVVEAAPEVIVQSLMDTPEEGGGGESLLSYWKRFGSIPAVARGRVHALRGDLLLRPGPRAAQGLAALVALLHPEAPPEAGMSTAGNVPPEPFAEGRATAAAAR